MTRKELKQLRCLNEEIADDERRLYEIEKLSVSPPASNLTGVPNGATPVSESRVERYAVEIADLRSLIEEKRQRRILEQIRLERWIGDIPDSYLRRIFTLHYVDGLSWNQVAHRIKGTTADAARMACKRYMDSAGG